MSKLSECLSFRLLICFAVAVILIQLYSDSLLDCAIGVASSCGYCRWLLAITESEIQTEYKYTARIVGIVSGTDLHNLHAVCVFFHLLIFYERLPAYHYSITGAFIVHELCFLNRSRQLLHLMHLTGTLT